MSENASFSYNSYPIAFTCSVSSMPEKRILNSRNPGIARFDQEYGFPDKGASIYDVRTEGGGGVNPKEDVVREVA